jgi:hypothetical protein
VIARSFFTHAGIALSSWALVACAKAKPVPDQSALAALDGGAPKLTSGCDADAKEFFRTKLWEPILSVRCIGCHNADGLAGGSRMVLVPDNVKDAVDQNYATVSRVAHVDYDGTPILLLRPEGLFPGGHAGGTLIPKGSADYMKLKAFVDAMNAGSCDPLASAECDPAKATPGHRVLRRLTTFEYDRTLSDLLGVAPKWGALFPPDDVAVGFDDIASAEHFAPLYTEKAREAAEDVGKTADLSSYLGCPIATGDDTCAKTFITTFGEKAFRRPLTDPETTRYQALETTIAASEGFEGGVRAVVTAMLQSPGFLYRTEIGEETNGSYVLTPWEVASELSYLLTSSMPDAALIADAKSGALARSDVVASHVKRLLATDGAKAALARFVDQWLLLGRLAIAVKDPNTYPELTADLRTAMHDESVAYFVDAMRTDGATLSSLYTSSKTFASPLLAKYYGLDSPTAPADASGLAPYALPSDRSGFLTQAALLTTQAKPDRPSPVLRGELVRVQLLCQALPPPPAGVNTQLPAVDPNVPNRQRFTAHSQNQPCQSCHQLMDPIGFGFEGFDGIGRKITSGSIDTSGEIVGTSATNGKFDGVANLASLLAASPDAQSCFALQWYRYGYGIDDTSDDTCGASKIAADFRTNGLTLTGLVLALVQADHFTRRLPDADDGAPVPPLPADDGGGSSVVPPPPPTVDAGTPSTTMSNVRVDVMTQSSWATGYCDNVTVTNTGSSDVAWTASIPAMGTVNNVWNATQTTNGNQWVFTGVSFNASLPANGTASFGFCAAL